MSYSPCKIRLNVNSENCRVTDMGSQGQTGSGRGSGLGDAKRILSQKQFKGWGSNKFRDVKKFLAVAKQLWGWQTNFRGWQNNWG